MQAVRIQKLLAEAGIGSRRQIESWIASGKIMVNGRMATLGQKITFDDNILLDNKKLNLNSETDNVRRVLMYHKPVGEICSKMRELNCKTVFEALPAIHNSRWVMVGRLDLNSSGVLLFTNDGEYAHQLMHPKFGLIRKYYVRVYGKINDNTLNNLRKGAMVDGKHCTFNTIEFNKTESNNQWFTVSLTEGRNREVRTIFMEHGLQVNRLIRIQYGEYVLPRNLRPGSYQELRV